jgi:hypothetical protein
MMKFVDRPYVTPEVASMARFLLSSHAMGDPIDRVAAKPKEVPKRLCKIQFNGVEES